MSKGYPRGGVGVFPNPLVVLSAEGMHSTQLLLLIPYFSSRFFRRGSMVFLKSLSIFFKKYLFNYLFIWLHWGLVAEHEIFSSGMWDLVPGPRIAPRPPALEVPLSLLCVPS